MQTTGGLAVFSFRIRSLARSDDGRREGIPKMAGSGVCLSGGLGSQYGWIVPRTADICQSLNLEFGWVPLPPTADTAEIERCSTTEPEFIFLHLPSPAAARLSYSFHASRRRPPALVAAI